MRNANTSTYAQFIQRIVERFDEESCKTLPLGAIKPCQTKLLHGLGGSINPTPFLKTNEEEVRFFDTFPRARYPLDEGISSQKEDMKIPSSKEDLDVRSLVGGKENSTIEEEKGKTREDNVVMTTAPQEPHEEGEGALAPRK